MKDFLEELNGQCQQPQRQTKIDRGNSSITINVEMWVKKVSSEPIGKSYCTTEAVFIYVAVDEKGKSRSLDENIANKNYP